MTMTEQEAKELSRKLAEVNRRSENKAGKNG